MAAVLRRLLLGCFLAILAATLALGLGILVPRPLPFGDTSKVAASPGEAQARRVLILSNPIHTDIALPADPDVLNAFGFVSKSGLELDYPGVFWIVFGWGGRSFYIETPTWGHLRPGPVIDALTWDASVLHVRRAGQIPQDLPTVRALDLGSAEFDRLVDSIRGSFLAGESGAVVSIAGAAYDSHDAFYPAKGGFNAFLGCNTWTGRMLRQAGYTTGAWTPLPVTLTWSLDLHNTR